MAYVQEIRKLVGHRPLIMTSASGALLNDRKYYCKLVLIRVIGAFQVAIWNLASPLPKQRSANLKRMLALWFNR